ncbi:hypothetical protein LMBV_017 [Largemouth bass virus]|uniref:Uncharacterized protein n=1 Tax=Largemouth bass virus TaxID=176656 RepID=A0A9X7Y3B2_9VIRU|nr:hypothetical protein LMBV_017 [Largemouth bass virus]QJE49166.1 hypothetical protein LMBV_017 [Largemouth bass virus]
MSALNFSPPTMCECNGEHCMLTERTTESDLEKRPHQFNYSSACLTHLLEHVNLSDMYPDKILSVGSGNGFLDDIIAKRVFGASKVLLTDSQPRHPAVQKMDCVEAIETVGHMYDTLMFCYPSTRSTGYKNCLDKFDGSCVIFIGDLTLTGRNNPDGLLEQLYAKYKQFGKTPLLKCKKSCSSSTKTDYISVFGSLR